MARPPHLHRKHCRVRMRAEAAIYHYRSYAYVEGDTFGHFLTEFCRVWQLAHEHGLSHVDGVWRLAEISPLKWRGYVTEIRGDFIYRQEGLFDLEADLPRFVGRLSQVFGQYGRAPFGPYLPPKEYTVRPAEDWLYQTWQEMMSTPPHCSSHRDGGSTLRQDRLGLEVPRSSRRHQCLSSLLPPDV